LIIALISAFISILSGFIGGVGISTILLRALVVIIIFSVFASVIYLIAITFLNSDTVNSTSSDENQPASDGSRVNIVLNEDDDALSGLYSEVEASGNVDETLSSGNEQKSGSKQSRSYTISGADNSLDIDSLPDLGSFSTTFSSASDNEEKNNDSELESGYNESKSYSSGRKLSAEGLAGTIAQQNSPEDLAKAVKTVLKKEETG
jgi:hypothetical protein